MSEFEQRATYDRQSDAVYVYLREATISRTQALDDYRNIDLDAAGNVVGVEFLGVSGGVDLHGVPARDRVDELIRPFNLRVFA